MDGRLSPEQRASSLNEMSSTELDVLVVGGGVVGAGAALDAVTRGLSVGLIEMRDWASGTSSRSSKIVHGGLRYLESLDLGRVREAARERGLLLDRIAPHLVHRVPFLYPLHHHAWERAYVAAGLALYDTIDRVSSLSPGLPSHRHLSKRSVQRIAPALSFDQLTGAVQYYDAQVDDARYVVTLARTAAAYGALVTNRVRAHGLIIENHRVVGVSVDDQDSGADLRIRAKVVVGAVGVWTDQLLQMTRAGGIELEVSPPARTTKGVHLVVPRDRIRSSTGMVTKTDNSVLMIIPWGRHWVIGTTATEWRLDHKRPTASAGDIDYLLTRANAVLASPLSRDDVEGCFAGLRPLPPGRSDGASAQQADQSVTSPIGGLVLAAGGTFTTYRVTAAAAIDAATRSIGGLISESITDKVPLLGADGYWARWNQRHLLARRAGLHVARVEHLLNRYGAMADTLLEMVAERPDLASPLSGAEDYLAAEIVYAVTHEGATHLTDILTRRTRIGIETWDGGVSAAPYVAELVADLLGWDDTQTSRQISTYLSRVEAERLSQTRAEEAHPPPAPSIPDDTSTWLGELRTE